METTVVWSHVAQQRRELADLLTTLDAAAWQTASVCRGWTVRDVAAHLTHATRPMPRLLLEAARGGFRFDAVVERMVAADRRSPEQITRELRAVADSRRHPPGTSAVEPLIDVLVHTQDICLPLGLRRTMPADAAVAAAERLWRTDFPFHARRRMAGRRLVATDADFAVGEGRELAAPIADLLLAMTGREAASIR
jgi:uncharacterized protein (TIGR03083 family)